MNKTLKIVIAPDSFKGTLSAVEASKAIQEGIISALKRKNLDEIAILESIPLSDGGEGMAETLAHFLNAKKEVCTAFDPLMREIKASFFLNSRTAIMEIAESAGITLLSEGEKNPMNTTTFGFGRMIAEAIKRGANKIIIGLGGSSTNDGALGALQALGLKIFDENGTFFENPITGKDLIRISTFKTDFLKNSLKGVTFILACDVKNPFYGKDGAAFVYGPQKGASAGECALLDSGLKNIANIFSNSLSTDISTVEGSGAAGGAAGGFLALTTASLTSGIDLILDAANFDEKIKNADLIITGEGKADLQTLMGKTAFGVLSRAKKLNVPTILLSGSVSDYEPLIQAGFADVISINPAGLSIEESLNPATAFNNLSKASENFVMKFLF